MFENKADTKYTGMKMVRPFLSLIFAAFIFVMSSGAAFACTNPTGVEGEIIFNEPSNVPAYCDGTDWVAMVGGDVNSFNSMLGNCSATTGDLNLALAGTYVTPAGEDYLGLWAEGNLVFSVNGWMGTGGGPLTVYSFDGNTFQNVASSTHLLNFAEGIWKNGDYIYVGSPGFSGSPDSGLHVFRWNGSTLTHLASNTTDVYQARQMSGEGGYIYVPSGDQGVHAFTFDGTTLTKVGGALPDTPSDFASGVYARNGYVYVAQSNGGVQVATFNGTSWTLIDTDTTELGAGRVWHDGDYLYATVDDGLAAYSFDGSDLAHIATYSIAGGGRNLWLDGNYIYVTENTGAESVYVFGFDGTTFSLIDSIALADGFGPRGISGNGSYIFVGVDGGNLHALSGFSCANSPYSTVTQIVPDGLIGHWRLDETSGTTIFDSSGNGNHGSLLGNLSYITSYSVPSPVGTTIESDTSPENNNAIRVEVPNVFPTGTNPPFTISSWINRTDVAESMFRGGDGITISRNISVFIPSSSNYGTSISIFNEWHHLVASYDGASVRLYINGILRHTANRSINITTGTFTFGGVQGPFGNGGAEFDDVRLYDRALSLEEIQEIYGATDGIRYNAPSKTLEYFDGNKFVSMTKDWPELGNGLIGHWKLDETTGSTAADSSGNGHNGNFVSMTAADGTIPGPVGRAMKFTSAAGARISIPHHNDLNINGQMSFAFWVLRSEITNIHQAMYKGDYNYQIEFVDNNFMLKQWGGSNNPVAFSGSTTRWHHVVISFDDTTNDALYYIDGEYFATTSIPEAMNTTDNLMLGRHNWNKVAALDDVRIYNRLLSESEARLLYNMGSSVGSSTALPQGCPNIGNICDDGTIYAGLSPDGNVPMYAVATTSPSNMRWNPDGPNNYTATGATDANTGEENTALILRTDGDSGTSGFQVHVAANFCASMNVHGNNDYYLPAREEMRLLYTNRALIGNLGTHQYWTSSETSTNNAYTFNFNDGSTNIYGTKNGGFRVRCVRKGPAPRCANPYGIEGEIVYNQDHEVVQFCDGARWIGVGRAPDPPPPPPPSAPSDMVAYWEFEETAGGVAEDSTPNNLDLTFAGSMTAAGASGAGVEGNAFTFNGSSNYLAELSNSPLLRIDQGTSFTASAWVNLSNNGQFRNILRYDDLDSADGDNINPRSYLIWGINTNGSIYFRYGDSGGTNSLHQTAASTLADGVWHHITVVRDVANDRSKIYLNGSKILDEADASTGTWETNGQYMLVGRYLNTGAGEHFSGQMDEIRFYRRALDDAEVSDLHLSSDYDHCSGTPAIGTVCNDGSVYAGLSPDNNERMFTTASSDTQLIYFSGALDQSTLASCDPAAGSGTIGYVPNSEASCRTGQANSNALLSAGSSQSVDILPVSHCNDLTAHGQNDWYLPSVGELHQVMSNGTAIGGFDTAKTWHWTSSWKSTDRFWQVSKTAGIRQDGAGTFPTTDYGVRCVRKEP